MELSSCKLAVFDLDGTLIDSHSFILKAFQYAVEPFGLSFDWNDIEKVRSNSHSALFHDYLSKQDSLTAYDRLEQYSQERCHELEPFAGINPMLSSLEAQNWNLAIWTAREQASTERIISKQGWDKVFHSFVTSSDAKQNKPAPDALELLAERFKLDAKEIVMIGDHHHDVEGARRAGSWSIKATWGTTNTVSHNTMHLPHLEVDCIKRLSTILQRQA